MSAFPKWVDEARVQAAKLVTGITRPQFQEWVRQYAREMATKSRQREVWLKTPENKRIGQCPKPEMDLIPPPGLQVPIHVAGAIVAAVYDAGVGGVHRVAPWGWNGCEAAVPDGLSPDEELAAIEYMCLVTLILDDGFVSLLPDVGEARVMEMFQAVKEHLKQQTVAAGAEAEGGASPPPKIAVDCYRLFLISGQKQVDIAEMLGREHKKHISQGAVSRWIARVEDWVSQGHILPDLRADAEAGSSRQIAVDPSKLPYLAKKSDGRFRPRKSRLQMDLDGD